jgi:hypothetical protein
MVFYNRLLLRELKTQKNRTALLAGSSLLSESIKRGWSDSYWR